MNQDFVRWLEEELEKRGWSQADLARNSGVSRASISNIVTSYRTPGPDVCSGIAQAFHIPAEEVFRRAGLLPPKPEETLANKEALTLFETLSDDEKVHIIEYMRFLVERRRNVARTTPVLQQAHT
jgi:transcriptional regulator with XRE-family HTH domain